MLDISIVLYNSSAHLPALVESLLRQSLPLNEIALIACDNASTDGSAEALEKLLAPHREKFRTVTLLRPPENLGFGRGHNLAIKEGSAPFVLILNPDAELHSNTLVLLLEAAKNDAKTAAWEARQSPYEHPKVYDPVSLETPWTSGACVLVRRSAFEQVHGFDEKIFLYGEDVDLSFRLREKGYVLRYVPQAVVMHRSYGRPNEVKPVQFISSVRANLLLRTRFGSGCDIGEGLLRQLRLLLPGKQVVPGQRRTVLQTLLLWLRDFRYWRKGASRALKPVFRGWEYAPHRTGAFYDISAGLTLAQHPKVSVLIRTLGKRNLLAMALQSIANQTYTNLEVVIAEDRSATLESFLAPWKEKLNIVYAPLGENKGRCLAGNAALEAATGDYCIFLDEDDLLYADHVEQLVAAAITQKARVAYAYAFELPSAYATDGDGITKEGELISRFTWKFSFPRLLNANYIPIQCVLFERSLYKECGGFDPAIPYNEDWNLWVRFAAKARPFALVPKTTSIYRVPMDHGQNAERHAVMLEHQRKLRTLHAQYRDLLTPEEKQAPASQSLGRRDRLIARYPYFRHPILLAAYIKRKCAW